MNAIRKEIRNRRAKLINQQDHISYFGCKGCPQRRAYKPSQKCRGCKVYKQLRSIGKELEQISKARRCSKQNKSNKKGEKQ
ncbi:MULTISPECIES: hypothetical protein [unclassified Lysinibacillus]|uniref:hypothetical protein n=1 Tax=unclassified Lysinibacillus TaxID=2636778 RepID=UPI00201B3722|nr:MULTISPECIES: hypothetical protein [unclassified Lysinibacillus]